MKLHEYQAKDLLAKFGVSVPKGKVAATPDDVVTIAEGLGYPCVVKAQIHAGGRGKGGGIKLVKNKDEAREAANAILGMTLVTHQTGPEGRLVKKVLVEQGSQIAKEYYLGMTLDRSKSRLCMMASTEGGMEIEEVAAKSPDKILKEWVDPAVGFQAYQGRNLAYKLGLPQELVSTFVKFAMALANAYVGLDASLMEINPLVVTKDNKMLALDCKLAIDDSAMFRHKDMMELRDMDEEDPAEMEAKKFDLNYISLDGNIGCMVNGAGLAMATMDIIKLYGGDPANFLDVGGGATKENVTEAFKIILNDPKVKGVLVNIFGGIMRCDVVAEGIVAAAKELHVKVPLVVRLRGTNVEKGREILSKSGLNITPAEGLAEAADKIVKASVI
ncbi:MAG: ADP-forming succinate--CoA ligase subunit beta [Deltaproteobacteria bacterium CG11_big_fil_rev_8_21_14_0_20_47_16]|nr:MAG: ADP-forming succinate--CoA ligase subunit beta [Deltaproteobacteria bacterium CG11_big_fil_rev_8_21_14_0_20_47_16]